jgi:hypothetical protein
MLPLQKLLCEVKASNNSIQTASNAARVESDLAKELQKALLERDKSIESWMELTKKNTLLEEELSLVKGKLHRLMQEKMKVERDSRAAISLARSLDMRTSSDAEFYKRKVRKLHHVKKKKKRSTFFLYMRSPHSVHDTGEVTSFVFFFLFVFMPYYLLKLLQCIHTLRNRLMS